MVRRSIEDVLLKRKAIWKDRQSGAWRFLCPCCASERRLRISPKITARHFMQVGIASLFVMMCLWPWMGVKGGVFFVPLWIGFEVVYRVQRRAALICDRCGFDPNLFLVDAERAKEEVKKFWERKLGPSLTTPNPDR